jgi:serine phosphatase RsbU (regulator of sigma subunit)
LADPAHDESTSAMDDASLTRTVIVRPGGAPGGSAAADDRAHYLLVVNGAGRGQRIELGDKPLVVGRSKPADLVLDDSQVSRNHCRLTLAMGELFVTDLGSSNGTYVAGRRINQPAFVAAGDRIGIGTHMLEHEWRSRGEVEAASAADDDLEGAKKYVRSLLPERIRDGSVRTDWVLQSSAKLGGDLFGYHFIDPRTFAVYLIDVTGHGADAAMHAVSVMNVVRRASLSGVDARDPARVAGYLNDMFQMDSHGGMLLSLWYGVYDLDGATLSYTSAGHHASYLVGPGRVDALPLGTANVLIGMMPDYAYRSGHAQVPRGSSLYVFSDGVFEIDAGDGREWGIDNFLPLLTAPARSGMTESRRILEAVQDATNRQSFEDDFTLVVATFG